MASAIREHLDAVRFAWPVEGARTLWSAIYDTEDPSLEVSFFLRDEGTVSIYAEPVRIVLS